MGKNNKRINNKTVLPKHKEKINKKRLKLTPNCSAIVTAHGKTKAYLHRFKITDSPECPCENGNQTVDHLIYECQRLQKETEALISNVAKQDAWSRKKSELTNKYIKQLVSVDKKNQLDVTFCILYFSSNSCSTCFGQPCAHHQELTTA